MNDPFIDFDLTDTTFEELACLIVVDVERNGREHTATARIEGRRICWMTTLGYYESTQEDCRAEAEAELRAAIAEVHAA